MIEFPLMVTKFLGKTIPSSGGFYLRTLPFKVIKDSIFKYQQKNIPSTFYIHSWEMTPEYMPRISLSTKDRFITYHNLDGVLNKMDFLLENFSFTSFERYIKNYF